MLFNSVAILGALAATAAADYASIVASLQLVDSDIGKLNTTVVAFNGDILLGIPVLSASSTLESDLQAGTTTAENSTELSSTDAINLVGPVGQLALDTNITLTNLINKYSEFKSDDLVGIVSYVLQTSKKDADAYSAAIIAKVPASLQSTAQNLYAPIDTAFENALAVYSS